MRYTSTLGPVALATLLLGVAACGPAPTDRGDGPAPAAEPDGDGQGDDEDELDDEDEVDCDFVRSQRSEIRWFDDRFLHVRKAIHAANEDSNDCAGCCYPFRWAKGFAPLGKQGPVS